MREELSYVSFFDDPFKAMLYQRKWAFSNWILRKGPEAERFKEIVEHMDKEIEKYIEENGMP
jgi:hypothetical protein